MTQMTDGKNIGTRTRSDFFFNFSVERRYARGVKKTNSHATMASLIRLATPGGGSIMSLAAFAADSPAFGRSILPITRARVTVKNDIPRGEEGGGGVEC